MIQSGFLSEEDRMALTALARDGSSPCRVTRRANALVLLDEGWSCQQVAHALLLDDDTIRAALTRDDDDGPASPIGAAIDALMQITLSTEIQK
jgi:hypothetical protein